MHYATKAINMVFAGMLALTLCAAAPHAGSLPATADDINPLRAGDRAPAFEVRTVENEAFNFDPDNLDKPVVLISFRGGWCPYCNLHLSELRTVLPQIRELGYDVYFISNDSADKLYSSLKDQTKEDIEGLDYVILSDADVNASVALGTAFQADPEYIKKLDSYGLDVEGSSITRENAMAVPAVYVIGADGTIDYDYVNADYRVRLPADELLTIAQENVQ